MRKYQYEQIEDRIVALYELRRTIKRVLPRANTAIAYVEAEIAFLLNKIRHIVWC